MGHIYKKKFTPPHRFPCCPSRAINTIKHTRVMDKKKPLRPSGDRSKLSKEERAAKVREEAFHYSLTGRRRPSVPASAS